MRNCHIFFLPTTGPKGIFLSTMVFEHRRIYAKQYSHLLSNASGRIFPKKKRTCCCCCSQRFFEFFRKHTADSLFAQYVVVQWSLCFCIRRLQNILLQNNEQQANKQTNDQTIKQANKQASKQADSKQTNKQTNRQTNRQTNQHSNNKQKINIKKNKNNKQYTKTAKLVSPQVAKKVCPLIHTHEYL